MKKRIAAAVMIMGCMMFSACSKNSAPAEVTTAEVGTTEVTKQPFLNASLHLIDNGAADAYTVNKDGTYSKGNYTYQYKLKLTGREQNAACDSWYEVLTNDPNITFHEVSWSLLSSQSSDWLDEKETVILRSGI